MNKGYKVPQWFNRIKPGSHGATPAQKRLWRIVAEQVKQEDWEQSPHCRGCDRYLNHWNEGHAGHFKRYSLCHSWFKFDHRNICLVCPGCNMTDDGPALFRMGAQLINKYGPDHLEWIETENLKYQGQKMQTWEIVNKVAALRPDLTSFDPRPFEDDDNNEDDKL